MDGQSEWLLCTVIKIGYGLFSYALQPAKRTSASLMGAILEEYLVTSLNSEEAGQLRCKNSIISQFYTVRGF